MKVAANASRVRLGTTRGQEMFAKAINDENYKIDRELLNDLCWRHLASKDRCVRMVEAYHLPVKNALQYFDDELSHIPSLTYTYHRIKSEKNE